MDKTNKSDMVSKKAAIAIITGIVVFVLAFFGIGGFFLFSHMQQAVAFPEQNTVEAYQQVSPEEPELLEEDEPYEPEDEKEGEDNDLEAAAYELVEEEPDIHPIVGAWRLVSTTDHINADMLEYGFVFYWHAYADGTARSRMYSPHSGWHTIEEYTWSISEDGYLTEVITYVNIQAYEMYLLGPEYAEMATEFIGVALSSNYEIDQDTFIQTMPFLTLVYQRMEE